MPYKDEAIEAVKTLISYIGDDPSRPALLDTPKKVLNTYKDFFRDYETHIAYIPNKKIVGISKLARLVDVFAKRLQSQENLTQQIADAINDYLKPKGVIVLVSAAHQCMTTRGVHKIGTKTATIASKGLFKVDDAKRREFLELIKKEM